MSKLRLTLAGAVMILGLAGFFGLLVFHREAKMEWIGLVVMFVGALAGYSRISCPGCLTKSVGIAVKLPAYCSSCGHRMEAEATRNTPSNLPCHDGVEVISRIQEES